MVPGNEPVTATAGGKVYSCTIENISASGLSLRFRGSMPTGNVIALDHPIAGTICGRCAWRKGNLMGVELQFPGDDLERVLRCVALVLNE